MDDPDLAEKMKARLRASSSGLLQDLQAAGGEQLQVYRESAHRENREAVKRDNNNVFDFLESEGYIRLKADASISSKELYEAYQIYCAENNLTTMKPRSFSDAVIGSQSRYNLANCNNVTNAAVAGYGAFSGSRRWCILIYRCFPVIRCVRTYRETHRRVAGLNHCTLRTQRLALLLIYCKQPHRLKWSFPFWEQPKRTGNAWILQAYLKQNAKREMFLTYPHTVRRIAGSRNCAHAAPSRADTARTGKSPVFPRSRIFRL